MHTQIRAFAALVSLSLVSMPGAADDSVWQDVPLERAQARAGGQPVYYRALRADEALLRAQLGAAPLEYATSHGSELSLPMPDGTMQRFEVRESPIMEPGLAARYPEIRTYRAVGIDDPSATGRLDVTPRGFHGMVIGASGTVYIDPESDANHYRSYFKHEFARARGLEVEAPVCSVHGVRHTHSDPFAAPRDSHARTGDQLRSYRLAVAATGEYTDFHGGSVSDGQAAIVTAINRVNEIYERDLAVRLVLVANNDSVVYTDEATDPYTNGSATSLLIENQVNLDSELGSANYDIGHVFGTAGGGLAGLGVTCSTSNKARGTTGLSFPTGDPFYIDFVAHEIGHQFGANHTFNGTTANCGGGNRNASTAYEPGSGSTIMAYAGICGAEDIQSSSDATFHGKSIEEILDYIAAGGACHSTAATGNSPPDADAGADFTIPCGTPFVLSGTGSDPDAGDTLTYQWDERDSGTATDSTTHGTDLGDNALFRSFVPRANSFRHFPRLNNQLANRRDKAETLPVTDRNVSFRLTVRDGNSGVDEDDMRVVVDRESGPFQIAALTPDQASYNAFDAVTIDWDVAGSDGSAVNCAFVDIDLLTFNASKTSYCVESLASNTANDGSQQVSIPALANTNARFRVMCRNNIFYDISNSDVTIVAVPVAPTNCISVDTAGGTSTDAAAAATCSAAGGGNVVVGSPGSGGGGGAFGVGLLSLLGLALGLRGRTTRRRSV